MKMLPYWNLVCWVGPIIELLERGSFQAASGWTGQRPTISLRVVSFQGVAPARWEIEEVLNIVCQIVMFSCRQVMNGFTRNIEDPGRVAPQILESRVSCTALSLTLTSQPLLAGTLWLFCMDLRIGGDSLNPFPGPSSRLHETKI